MLLYRAMRFVEFSQKFHKDKLNGIAHYFQSHSGTVNLIKRVNLIKILRQIDDVIRNFNKFILKSTMELDWTGRSDQLRTKEFHLLK